LVTDLADGQDVLNGGNILASNAQLHPALLKVLQGAHPAA
jgi:hypothetical protein